MVGTAIIVFREVLEAALIVSIVLAASCGAPSRNLWVCGGVAAGVGQELFSAQLRLDLTAEAPLRFMHEPPGYQLHVWRGDSGLVTHTAGFGEWPDPHPLRAAS